MLVGKRGIAALEVLMLATCSLLWYQVEQTGGDAGLNFNAGKKLEP